MPTYRHGALYVVEETRPKDPINRELKKLDPHLFVERQLTFDGEYVWCVVREMEGEQPPLTLLEWRDPDGNPIPELGHGIVERMKRMERDAETLISSIKEQNARERARREQRAYEEYEQMTKEMLPKIQGKERYVLPRSHSLKRARDKRRNIGELR